MKTISKALLRAAKVVVQAPTSPQSLGTGEWVGKIVRAQAPGKRAQMGIVIGESHAGRCWMIKTSRGAEDYLKEYVQAIPSKMAGKGVRRLAQVLRQDLKGKIYGSGDLD